ncbi:ATP-grasp domain-containing protein [Saccharibacter sp. 17.LH.SD]|uniref:ATP-grasp domain-containing protein n=1 Tax=Saccharibacter sp. 17.LH.SD TaxID=2689393 RepID=UPI00136900B7|nr:ATP-grasp domain-containing protein [Saccharibacter sp. 17.LH.SD]MXV44560.1 ATP-grasp domain-containing protein [Saccharibacter sp. 17.LH.SD]
MTDKNPEHHNPLSMFEFWPESLFYTPIVLYWIIMGLRYRDLSIATAANPRIETGGLCGESKSSILDMGGPIAQTAIAPYRVFRNGKDALSRALAAMEELNLSFPVVVKPDIGCNGTGVRLIADRETLEKVLPLFPNDVSLLIQKLIPYPVEAGIFYIRHPNEKTGQLTSVTYKEAPIIIGDGTSTLRELVLKDPRMSQVPQLYLPRLNGQDDVVLPAGEQRSLVFAGNHCKGSIFRDGRYDVTNELTHRINDIMMDIPDFHFGRIDVKATSIEDLRRGEGFEIIEINGVGSEAIHIWDRRTTLWEAYKTQFYHYRQTFLIGAANKKKGWRSSGALSLFQSWIKQRRLLASYPVND